jgi:hypothetical protein
MGISQILRCLEVALLLRCGFTMSIYLYAKIFPPHESPVHNGVVKAVHGLAMGFAPNLAICIIALLILTPIPRSNLPLI